MERLDMPPLKVCLRSVRCCLHSFAAFLVASALLGQAPQGEIQLLVKDSSGAPMRASGRLESTAGRLTRDFQTDAQGKIVLEKLPFGQYRLQISKSGFTTQSIAIDIQSTTPVTRSISMEIGAQRAKVDVVSQTPLGGTDLEINQIAAPVQTATAVDIKDSGALDLSDFMNRRMNGVYLNEMQGNPYQPDVNYRGYTASPLLGTPTAGLYRSISMEFAKIRRLVTWSAGILSPVTRFPRLR